MNFEFKLFQDLIIVWCLEKINPSLPSLIKNTVSSQLEISSSLREIHAQIFSHIPNVLDLKKSELNEDLSHREGRV